MQTTVGAVFDRQGGFATGPLAGHYWAVFDRQGGLATGPLAGHYWAVFDRQGGRPQVAPTGYIAGESLVYPIKYYTREELLANAFGGADK